MYLNQIIFVLQVNYVLKKHPGNYNLNAWNKYESRQHIMYR